jgi:hypothetical protein
MGSSSTTPGRRWILRVAAMLAGTSVGLVAAEAGARFVWRGPPVNLPDMEWSLGEERVWFSPHISQHDELGFYFTPGFQGLIAEPEAQAHLRVNSLGMRAPEPFPKADGAERWLMVGDSFTVAMQVDEDQTFVHLLQDRVGIETWNAGVDCYGTYQALGRYRQLEAALEPDAVLLTFTLSNDLIDNLGGEDFNPSPVPEAMHELDYGKALGDKLRAEHPLLHHSRIFSRLYLRQGLALGHSVDWLHPELMLHYFESYFASPDEIERAMAMTEPALRGMAEETAAHGDRLMVALVPPMFAVDEHDLERWTDLAQSYDRQRAHLDTRATPDALLATLEALDIPSCDLEPALAQAQAAGQACYLPQNRHWTVVGHQVVADAIAACMQREWPAGGGTQDD